MPLGRTNSMIGKGIQWLVPDATALGNYKSPRVFGGMEGRTTTIRYHLEETQKRLVGCCV